MQHFLKSLKKYFVLRKNADEVIPKKLHIIVFLSKKVSCTEEFDMLGNASLALIHSPPPMINRVIMDCGQGREFC